MGRYKCWRYVFNKFHTIGGFLRNENSIWHHENKILRMNESKNDFEVYVDYEEKMRRKWTKQQVLT